MMNNILKTKFGAYQEWRASLTQSISDYRDWLAKSEHMDAVQELRLYDVLEMLKRDKLVMAFLAEFSRGKTETINALFFADFNQRLLPSEPGRTTVCSTEIFWDARDEPSIRLLPIETRVNDDTLAYLKTTPNIWKKFRLNLNSAEEMKQTLGKLIDQKMVTQSEAERYGLFNAQDADMLQTLKTQGLVKIPAWRHAIINYPHPLLKSGLVIIDTPGLNTLGAEPELMLNILPNAHAVLFLTATDTGVTQSDMRIWNDFIKGRAKHKLVLLNKIDMLWDEMKSKQDVSNEIEKQVNMTAHQLGISPDSIFAISAQKALVAKIKKNQALLEQSGILTLETNLSEQIIRAKHEILGRSIASECSSMVKNTRKLVQQRLVHLREQMAELRSLRGQNIDASKHILAKVVADRKRYESSIISFNQANDKISVLGNKLLHHVSLNHLEASLAENRQAMGDSWTTVGLNKSMRNLIKQANTLAENVTNSSKDIKKLADNIYDVFRTKHGFEIAAPPDLNMADFMRDMQALAKITDDFCTDPVNVLTEKHFLIRKFFLGLGAQMQKIFVQAEKDCERWLEDVLGRLKTQVTQHKDSLDQRTKNLTEAKASAEALDKRLGMLEHEHAIIASQSMALDKMLLQLMRAIKPVVTLETTVGSHAKPQTWGSALLLK